MSAHTIHISTMLSHEVRNRDGQIVAIFSSDHCARVFLAAYESGLHPKQIKELHDRIKELESANRGLVLLQQADRERIHTLQEEVRMLQASCDEHIRIRNELGAMIEEIRDITE